jgi:hypothetical protein
VEAAINQELLYLTPQEAEQMVLWADHPDEASAFFGTLKKMLQA